MSENDSGCVFTGIVLMYSERFLNDLNWPEFLLKYLV